MAALFTLMVLIYALMAHWSIHQGKAEYAVYLLGVLWTFRPKVTLISTAHTPQGLQRWLNFHFARLIA